MNLLSIFILGGLGANLRYLIGLMAQRFFPYIWVGTLTANILGALLFFLSFKLAENHFSQQQLQLFRVGFLGALTTFSAFSYELVELINRGKTLEALLVLTLNILGGVLIGVWIIR